MAKVVLAYTGGLATSLCIHWLRMKKGLDVVTFTANVGQGVNLEPIGERALELGASAAHIGDLRERYVRDFAFPALRAGAVYESGYFLGTALTRPLIVSEMARIAVQERIEHIAHGCPGRGNDRVRFETAVAALAPELKILSPLEEWGLKTREELVRYAERYGLVSAAPLDGTAFAAVDQNLWGVARPHDASTLDPWSPVPDGLYRMTRSPADAPDDATEVEISFDRGAPIRLRSRSAKTPIVIDGETQESVSSPVQILEALNALGGQHGVGRNDVIEDRIGGVKTREIYEAPAATILYHAHRALESLVMPKALIGFSGQLSRRYAELVYVGMWWSDLRESLDAYFGRAQEKVCGDVRVRLYKGSASVVGTQSPFSLYDQALAQAAANESGHEAARGLSDSRSYAMLRRSRAGEDEEHDDQDFVGGAD